MLQAFRDSFASRTFLWEPIKLESFNGGSERVRNRYFHIILEYHCVRRVQTLCLYACGICLKETLYLRPYSS